MIEVTNKQLHIKQSLNSDKLVSFRDAVLENEQNNDVLHDTQKYFKASHIGCDETGSTDFFGPLCVVAC